MEGAKLDSTRGWTKLYVDIMVPSGTDSLLLFCSMIGDGTSWFDDIRLEKSAEPVGQPLSAKQYPGTSLAFASHTVLYEDSVDLQPLIADAQVVCVDAKTTAGCYSAVTYVLQNLKDCTSAKNTIGMYHQTL